MIFLHEIYFSLLELKVILKQLGAIKIMTLVEYFLSKFKFKNIFPILMTNSGKKVIL